MSVATTSAASKWGMENTVCPAGIHEEVERIDVEHKQVFFMPKLQAKLKDTSQCGVCYYDIKTGQYSGDLEEKIFSIAFGLNPD